MCGAQNASDSFCIAEILPPHGKGPARASDPAEGLIKKGPLAVAGRPKSREETPKVGLDHAGRTQHVATGIWACSCWYAIGTAQKIAQLRVRRG
jgi:hypothetical protein